MKTIGIDMSKDTFHACFDDEKVKVFANTKPGIKQFINALLAAGYVSSDTVIGTEATGVYHLFFCVQASRAGWKVNVINPILTHRIISSSLRKVKTDRHDAVAVRTATLAGYGYAFTDTAEVLALKTLVQQREVLCRLRAQNKQRMGAHAVKEKACETQLYNSITPVMQAILKEIAILERHMAAFAPDTQKLLRSIPGIGIATAATLVAYVGDIKRFSSPEKLVAYVGLDARVYQSGTSIHGKGYLTKRGNSSLRSMLFNAAFIARQHNPDLKRYFEKKISEGKHYYSALCAVERKLTHLIYAVWSRGTPYEAR